LLRVLPEASSEDRWFALLLAEPRGFARVWELELDRESLRRAFASGLSGEKIIARLEALGARPLPQSLAFSISSWEEEYRSLRLYHGFVLVCDERKRNLVERNPALASLVMERLGEGVFILAARGVEEIRQRLAAAGIEAPPEIHSHAAALDRAEGISNVPSQDHSAPGGNAGDAPESDFPAVSGTREAARLRREAEALWRRIGEGSGRSFDPGPRVEALKAELATVRLAEGPALPASEVAKELSDRVDRRVILDVDQLTRAELRIERLEAGGMDYSGKTRIVERALRSTGDRLEIYYQLSGSSPAHATVRPVRLEKTDKGLVLEAEDLETGGPLRVPLGAASSVRRLRASFFGEE
ncbi:MAG: helicase-associated domain-containing protein, partial [Spirochaetota bacterium]